MTETTSGILDLDRGSGKAQPPSQRRASARPLPGLQSAYSPGIPKTPDPTPQQPGTSYRIQAQMRFTNMECLGPGVIPWKTNTGVMFTFRKPSSSCRPIQLPGARARLDRALFFGRQAWLDMKNNLLRVRVQKDFALGARYFPPGIFCQLWNSQKCLVLLKPPHTNQSVCR